MISHRMICAGALLLCLIMATSVKAQEPASATEAQMGFYLASPDGSIQTISLESFFESLVQGGPCNGGSVWCTSVSVNCPTSGGPTCTASQICTCRCKMIDNQAIAYNYCLNGLDPDT
jgi:hypothetical protein